MSSARETFTLVLKQAELIAPQVRHLVFQRQGDEPFVFVPGQFITLLIETGGEKLMRRSYSIANTHITGGNTVEFAASYVQGGTASDLLFNLQPGETVTASGPFGRLILRDEQPGRYILIATGTGVTPYRAMLDEIARRLQQQADLKVILLFGVRGPEELLYRAEFVAFTEQYPRFEFRAYYSRARCHERYEHQGHVQVAFADIQPDPAKDIVYLCGNPNMIDEAFAQLTARGFASQNVRREKYISS
jgi:ferredoxin-NADP reductase